MRKKYIELLTQMFYDLMFILICVSEIGFGFDPIIVLLCMILVAVRKNHIFK